MNNRPFLSLLIVSFVFAVFSCNENKSEKTLPSFNLEISNPLDTERIDAYILFSEIELLDKYPDFNPEGFVVYNKDVEIPSQYNFSKEEKGLAIVIPFIAANETLNLTVSYNSDGGIVRDYPKRTQAELSHKFDGKFEDRKYVGGEFRNVDKLHVPAEHTDHSWFIRYEGPGWESDKVGYRFYLDWRNGVDVFGKKVTENVLQNVGQDGFDSYHEMSDWGMDVLKVAKSLGVGSIATFENELARRVDVTDSLYAEITNNGVIYSSILTKYFGWDIESGKTDLTSKISIHAGTRLTKQVLNSSAPIDNFATGLIKDKKAELITGGEDQKYGYLATYGKQSLNDDNLGIVVFFKNDQKIEITEDPFSHVVVLKPNDNSITYYFAAAWELEPEGITDLSGFKAYLDKTVLELSNPLQGSVK
ncbi:DUF4861 domain-containing protein [Belliella sp. R4-6]|uniref:DUF4861 domain-containing protein n=1 Tax=Belliella alkalica TaxID=1730871 RepID=A0ABS9VDD1_9BACT|nr:DUF4861 domain-containing protein [Belliella alkalica]MCH7413903.1 DUF4861 domain-containing protein [Belliella alkalica]